MNLPGRLRFPELLQYRATACFGDQLSRYLEQFERENVHVVVFDDFSDDPRREYRRVLDFLKLPHAADDGPFEVINPATGVRSPVMRELTKHPPITTKRIARVLLPRRVRRCLRQWIEAVVRRYNTRLLDHSPQDEMMCTQLKDEFRSDVAKLSGMLGRDLSHWSR